MFQQGTFRLFPNGKRGAHARVAPAIRLGIIFTCFNRSLVPGSTTSGFEGAYVVLRMVVVYGAGVAIRFWRTTASFNTLIYGKVCKQ